MVEILPNETALIVIDPQNGMCHPRGTLGESGVDTRRLMAIIPRLAELVTACRAVAIPDLWTRHYNLAEDRARDARRITPHTKKRKRVACQPGTWDSEFVDDLIPLAESATRIIEKYRWSAFHATNLDTLLHALGTRLVVVAGTTTNACIDTTVRDAYTRDYDVVIVEDCVAGVRPDWEEAALAVLGHYAAEVVSLADFKKMLPASGKEK
jgi:ureidoacrylate peracid hydrolase